MTTYNGVNGDVGSWLCRRHRRDFRGEDHASDHGDGDLYVSLCRQQSTDDCKISDSPEAMSASPASTAAAAGASVSAGCRASKVLAMFDKTFSRRRLPDSKRLRAG
jgi:hypothetical protein